MLGAAVRGNVLAGLPRTYELPRGRGPAAAGRPVAVGRRERMVALGRALMATRGSAPRQAVGRPRPGVVAEIGRIVERLKAAGTTVLMVEQNVRLALAIAERFVALRDGWVAHGPVSELRGAYEDLVRRIYL